MSMKDSNPLKSPCEIIRQINDLVQENTKKDEKIRDLCAEAQAKVKLLAKKLHKYTGKEKYWIGWWEKNNRWRNILSLRHSKTYKYSKYKKK